MVRVMQTQLPTFGEIELLLIWPQYGLELSMD